MDAATHNLLSFAGVRCRVIGTFYLDEAPDSFGADELVLRFGSDISNYYPNRGLKVFKPTGAALAAIVNYRDAFRQDQRTDATVAIGTVRYASTHRSFQGVADVPVEIMPADLLGQKSALFGMTRSGKSNTTKVILKSVFDLRTALVKPLRIGQLVFDPDGEYANENVQDQNKARNPSAIKNIWRSTGNKADVVTYGIAQHPDDPGRKLMLVNFYEARNLQIGKELIDATLAEDNAKFISNFRQVVFREPQAYSDPDAYRSAKVRYDRRVLVYRALLDRASFAAPKNLTPDTKGLFNQDLIRSMSNSSGPNAVEYAAAARIFGSSASVTWSQVSTACEHLAEFIADRQSGYQAFEQTYVQRSSTGENWADDDLKKILEMFRYANGSRQIGKARSHHTTTTTDDYVVEIYKDLVDGKLVIVDQSSGDAEVNSASAERLMWHIFRRNQAVFRSGKPPPDILIYIEEAHNLLPAGSDLDLQNVWVKAAKEGGKYAIGMIYATQEVNSIQRNILKATANWFIGHLNNTDETKELCKYYDFADFESSIRRAQDRGFVRVKTLSNLFVVPTQVHKFEV